MELRDCVLTNNRLNIDCGFLSRLDQNLCEYLVSLFRDKFSLDVINTIASGRYCLAGGAIRAYYENRAARDMDIYVLEDDPYEAMQGIVSNWKKESLTLNLPNAVTTITLANPCGEFLLEKAGPPGNPGTDFEFGLAEFKCRKNNEHLIGPYRTGLYRYPYKLINYISMDTEDVQFLHVSYVPDYLEKRVTKKLPKKSDVGAADLITASTLDEVLEGFDFVCCQAALEFTVTKNDSGIGIMFDNFKQSPLFLTTVAKRELRISPEKNMQKCGAPYHRIYKYVTEYGYKILTKEDFKLLERMRFYALMDGFDPEEEHYGDVE